MEIEEDNIKVNKDDFLWKYMDVHKFLYLLNENKFYFTRMDLFEDPLEGLSDNIIWDKFSYDRIPERNKINPNILENVIEKILNDKEIGLKNLEKKTKQIQKSMFASCWFTSNRESMAMWNIYSNNDSIAIRFKADYLISLIKEAAKGKDEYNMTIGNCDYRALYPPELDPAKKKKIENRFVAHKKDESYSHEREFRFVIYPNVIDESLFGIGLEIPNLKKLKFHIVANPHMPDWQFENLKKLLKEKYQLNRKLITSSMLIKKPNR